METAEIVFEEEDVVTIVGDPNISAFHGAQGQVVKVEGEGDEKKVHVKIGPAHEFLLGYCESEEDKTIRFLAGELQKDEGWSPENRARLAFGRNMFHHIHYLPEKLDPNEPCMRDKCPNKRKVRIMVNIWGVVCDVDVCDDCKEKWDGKCIEVFPWRK